MNGLFRLAGVSRLADTPGAYRYIYVDSVRGLRAS